MINERLIGEFGDIIRYDVTGYLQDYTSLIGENRSRIFAYYNGEDVIPNEESFNLLERMVFASSRIENLTNTHRDRFTTALYWSLLDMMSDIKTSIETIDNSSKWLRSSIEKTNFTPEIEIQTSLAQNQTLEKLSSDTGATDPNNDWISIALRNDLREEDYTTSGGNTLVTGYRNRRTIRLRSVVDNIAGEKIHGLDIDRNITFVNDDLKVLGYKETVTQAVEILAGLRQGSTPEFPTDGIQQNLVVGQNKNSVAFPVLMRQFFNTFRKDDTLKNLTISKITQLTDGIAVEFTVKTRLDETIIVNSTI